jgi:DNA-binding SARP family transcriptional activator/predicted ATPase
MATESSTRLSLLLLGPYRATVGDEPLAESRTKKIEALLAYLAVNGEQAYRRETLVGMFFPDMVDEAARTNLRQTLARLRQAIRDRDANPPFLLITRESVQFNLASEHFVDVTSFEQLQGGCPHHHGRRNALCLECMAGAQQALDLYRGPLMDGFFLEDSVVFDEWLQPVRERLREIALALAAQLGDFYERRGEYAAAEAAARRQLEMEPWREEAHLQLMRVLAYQGRRGDALRQYDRLAELLETDLGLEPMPATEQLRRQIVLATEVRSHNLPPRDHSFVGRTAELALINEHLVNPERRLISLVGPGGSGKTALAIEAGWTASSNYLGPFIHGVFMISLAGVRAPSASDSGAASGYDPLLTAVADGLGFRPTVDPDSELVNYLGDRRLLLILDNVEQLMGAARKLVSALLRGAPSLQILATSRTRLNLAEEWLVEVGGLPVPGLPVPGLPVPGPPIKGQLPAATAEAAFNGDAPSLFVRRAARLMPEIHSEEGLRRCPEETIIRICQLVQGLPLGVELAASWVRLLSCGEIAVELEKNLDFLRSSAADLEERHRSLRAVFDYSWALLEDPDRKIFGRLAVFSGSFDRSAAETVTGATMHNLARLVDYSLLQRRDAGAQKSQRFEILESLRHFAAEKQQATAEGLDPLNERYSAYHLNFLALRLVDLRSKLQQSTLNEIAQEIDNIRAAWRLAVEQVDIAGLAAAHEALALFYYMRSWFAEGESQFKLAFDGLAGQPHDEQRQRLRAQLLAWYGWFVTLRGQVPFGRQHLNEAVSMLREQDAMGALAGALPYLAIATSTSGDIESAERLAREALQLSEQLGNQVIEAVSANVLSQVLYLHGDYEQAREYGQRSLALERDCGNYWSMAFSLVNLGRAAFASADYGHASTHYQEAIEIRESLGDARGKALGLLYLGDAALAKEDLGQARPAYQESLTIFREIGSRQGSAEALNRLAGIARLEKRLAHALRDYAEALELALEARVARPMLQALLGLAAILADELPQKSWMAARIVAAHPATGESDHRVAVDLVTQLQSEAGSQPAETMEPEAAMTLLNEVAEEILQLARNRPASLTR